MGNNFYPRPPGGGRPRSGAERRGRRYFYPRPPGGGRPFTRLCYGAATEISIHALRVEGDPRCFFIFRHSKISIHALRVEGDQLFDYTCSHARISIHALRVEGDRGQCLRKVSLTLAFLSTPSGWRATRALALTKFENARHFYPRPPGGGRHSTEHTGR